MPKKPTTPKQLLLELEDLRARLDDAEETLRAIRNGEVDALIVSGVGGEQVFTLKGADHSYRTLIEDMNEGALTLTAEGVILYANLRFAEMLKTPLEKVIGSAIHTWVVPDSQKILQALLRRDDAKARHRGEVTLLASDGTLVPGYLSTNVLQTEEMQGLLCMVATDLTVQKRTEAIAASEKSARELLAAAQESRLALLSVIEERKRVEEKLVRLNQQHKLILCSVAEGILGLDLQGNHIFVNPAAARMLGYGAEELLGRPSHSTWHHTKPDGSHCLEEECAICTSYREGAAYSVATDVFWRKDGTSFPVEYAIKPIYEQDRLVGTVLTFADITERRQAEKQIHRQSKLLAAINSVFFETLTSDNEETVAKTCLKVAQEITDSKFGIIGEITPEGLFTATYLSDPGWEACRIPETQAIVLLKDMVIRGIWGQVILKEQSLIVNDPVSYPDRVGIPEGHPPLTSFLGVPLRDQGKVIGMIALANNASGYKAEHQQDMEALCVAFVEAIRRKQAENDLSKTLKNLKESQDMLIRSEKLSAIGQLSAGVAHEILNPVNIMGMKLQMLEMTEALSEKTKEAIRTCENQIKRITKITRDLQQFARVSEKQITPSNINELIEQVFSLMGPRIKIEDVKVDARYQADLPLVPLDRDRMGQIVLNLINNALDAMKGQPERVLRVTTELTDKNVVRLSFSDTGTGIPPEILSKIFDPFFTTKEEGKGTGLGLSISYGIIQDHGGTILAENNAEGGASFFIDLPVEGTDGGK
jgi:PAS domain S-box-containing protein